MKFLKNVAKVTLVSAVALGAGTLAQTQQAQAFTIGNGDVLSLTSGAGGVSVGAGLDFYGLGGPTAPGSGSVLVTSASTGAFNALANTTGFISDLTAGDFADLANGIPVNLFRLTLGTAALGDDISFLLTGYTPGGFVPVSGGGVAFASFTGQFTNVVGEVLGLGAATATLFPNGPTNTLVGGWSANINSAVQDTVPTPALIPGIAAMGLGLLRKRNKKAQEVAA
jgi:hypothetical protein